MSDVAWFTPASPTDELADLFALHNSNMELARQFTSREFTIADDGHVCAGRFDVGYLELTDDMTIHLPLDPDTYEPGARYTFLLTGNGGGDTLTIGRNGENIQGSAADATMGAPNNPNTFIWSGTSYGWILYEGF